MNTISPPPEFKRISGTKRLFGVVLGLGGAAAANALLGYSVFSFYTRNTTFVPYDISSPDLLTPVATKHNPLKNKPVCIDHAIKTLPLQKFRERYGLNEGADVPVERLTTDFCRGIWSGIGFRVQRRYLERKYRALEGREDHLWDVKQLEKSEYPVGQNIVDHFEVVEHSPNKVVVRCGDSPLNQDHRASDGLFSMEVSTDEKADTATFHLKSVFVNTTPEGKDLEPLPWKFQLAHRWYTKLWMEGATRKMLTHSVNEDPFSDEIDEDVSDQAKVDRKQPSATKSYASQDEGFHAPSGFVGKKPQNHDRHPFLSGWRVGALVSLVGATLVFILNLSVTIYVWTGPYKKLDGAIGTLFEGSCAKARHLNVWIHLLVNVLSTLLLGASNYCMQVLSAPNREELVRAHGRRIWLHIGVPSLRNLRHIGRPRAVLWLTLFLSSMPLHLLFNSVVFTNLQANDYTVVPTTEEWLRGGKYDFSSFLDSGADDTDATVPDWEDWRINATDAGGNFINNRDFTTQYNRLDTAKCFEKYNDQYLSDAGNFYAAAIIFGIVCIARSLSGLPTDPVKLWQIGFGTIAGNNLLSVGTALGGGILLANAPQAALSYLYLAFNALYTNMFVAQEWSTYMTERKPLRVTSPVGQQRSTYWLNVPFRYAIPMTILSGLFHWLASQSIFLVQITITNSKTRAEYDKISTCGFSPLAIILCTILGSIIALGGFVIGRFRYAAGMPVAGSCSAAISAACHPLPEDTDASVLPVQWGAVSHGDRSGEGAAAVGHCTFSSLPVEQPIRGRFYA
ncbi:hypothetical protein N0V94_004555 [Neodidymelliopsis sp. IMI 364377]|nr:hypothetical protein N0V94_004555 [Neodidymelliopsis sp. IMI 364377]